MSCQQQLRDTDVLCSSLTYEQGAPAVLEGELVSPYVRVYQPQFEEFQISRVAVPQHEQVTLPEVATPRILLVDRGGGTAQAAGMHTSGSVAEAALARGGVFFVPASVSVQVVAGQQGVTLWEASCNTKYL